jgi:hypothetical protein
MDVEIRSTRRRRIARTALILLTAPSWAPAGVAVARAQVTAAPAEVAAAPAEAAAAPAGVAAADRPPDPASLWDAYPLAERPAGGGGTAGAAPAQRPRASAPEAPASGAHERTAARRAEPADSGAGERPASRGDEPPAAEPAPSLAATDQGDHGRFALAALVGFASALVVTGAFALLRRSPRARPPFPVAWYARSFRRVRRFGPSRRRAKAGVP